METIKIRIGTVNDIDKLVKLSQLWVEKDEQLKREMLTDCFKLPNYIIIVAENGGVLIGWLSVYIRLSWVNTERRLWISSVFVHPNYRMKGITRMMWKKIEESFNYDVALIDTRLDYPLHLGFEHGTNLIFYKRKVK